MPLMTHMWGTTSKMVVTSSQRVTYYITYYILYDITYYGIKACRSFTVNLTMLLLQGLTAYNQF